jgi:hypothetical protein
MPNSATKVRLVQQLSARRDTGWPLGEVDDQRWTHAEDGVVVQELVAGREHVGGQRAKPGHRP